MLLRGENDIKRDFAMDRQESICFVGSDRIFLLSQWQWVGKLLNVDNGCETRSPTSNSHPLCYWWQSLKSGRYIWRFSNLAHVLSCNKVLAIAISSSPNLRVVPTKKFETLISYVLHKVSIYPQHRHCNVLLKIWDTKEQTHAAGTLAPNS